MLFRFFDFPKPIWKKGNCGPPCCLAGFQVSLAKLDPGPLRYVTWGSKGLPSFEHLEDRDLELYKDILVEARSWFEPGKRIRRVTTG